MRARADYLLLAVTFAPAFVSVTCPPGSWLLVPDSWSLILGPCFEWSMVLYSLFLILTPWFLVLSPDSRFLVPSSRFPVLDTEIPVSDSSPSQWLLFCFPFTIIFR